MRVKKHTWLGRIRQRLIAVKKNLFVSLGAQQNKISRWRWDERQERDGLKRRPALKWIGLSGKGQLRLAAFQAQFFALLADGAGAFECLFFAVFGD